MNMNEFAKYRCKQPRRHLKQKHIYNLTTQTPSGGGRYYCKQKSVLICPQQECNRSAVQVLVVVGFSRESWIGK